MREAARKFLPVRFIASYGLAVVVLLFLLLLTFLGTLEQVDHGLYAAQKKYFQSAVLVHEFFGVVPAPLPGVYTLLVVGFANLLAGGVIRARKGWKQAGILTAHAGVLLLLLGAFVGFEFGDRGQLTLYEGEQANSIVSPESWEIAIARAASATQTREYLLPEDAFAEATQTNPVTFHADGLPFEVVLSDYFPNARPRPAGDGIERLDTRREAEQNVPALRVVVAPEDSNQSHQKILWGLDETPWRVSIDGGQWLVELRRRTRTLPFYVRLDKFTRELHPGTDIPKTFKSDVTIVGENYSQQAVISMNEPLRYGGYTFYQASWGPPDAAPGHPLYSSLAVVRNPAENWPLWACTVICIGLAIHFGRKLAVYLATETGKVS